MTAMMAFPMLAQYTGPGYYRIHNQGAASRYISIVHNDVEKQYKDKNNLEHIITTSAYGFNIDIYALKTVKKPVSDPGTILYISGSESDGLVIEGQGVNTKDLTQGYNLMYRSNILYSTYKGTQANLADLNETPDSKDSHSCICGNSKLKDYGSFSKWDFKKIDNDTEYFGLNPKENVVIEGKYYTTLYADFSIQLPNGMKAYYIDQHIYDTDHVQEPIAELKEIADGKIPAATPVIIECSSNTAEDNKVTIISENLSKISGNELAGRYFCNIIFKGTTTTENEGETELKNALEFDKNTMRVLGVKDGKLAMVDDNDNALTVTTKSNGKGRYIPANKAYLPINSSEASATAIKLLTPDEYQVATSISKVNADDSAPKGIFTLSGVRVKEDANNLPSGIYIVDGKKQVIR